MSDLQFIDINERAYRYIRQFTIKSAEDAAIELITNCNDAYNKGNITNKLIEIEYCEGIMKFRDRAIGLTSQEMVGSFLQVGQYTNIAGNRGFFSRGAKDISAIADVEFYAVKNGLYSKVILNSDAYGKLDVADIPFTDELSKSIGIPIDSNGLLVTLKLLPNFYVVDPSGFAESISKLAVLRDIMADKNTTTLFTQFDKNGNTLFSRRLIYGYPDADLLLELSYIVPGYENYNAKWTVYKTNAPIEQPKKENELRFGFLIKDKTTIYEAGTIDDRFRWNPYINYLYGDLVCDGISDMLRDYDTNGSSEKNPLPIIDPSRLTGTNKQHPFIMGLLSIPKVRLDLILRELNTGISQQTITINEIDDLMNELEKYGLDLMDDQDINVSFTPSYDSQLVKSVQDDRLNYITTEKSYILTGNYSINKSEMDKYIENLIKQQIAQDGSVPYDLSYILGNDDNLIQLPSNIQQDSTTLLDNLEFLPPDIANQLAQNPYIYSVGPDGNLKKLYIFQQGNFDNVTDPDAEYLTIQNKKFSVNFINDINITKRYTIDYTDGINININLNDQVVNKYVVDASAAINTSTGTRDINPLTDINISDMTSVKSLVFLKELFVSILSDIILDSDVNSGKIMLDANYDANNTKKIIDYQNNLISKIQLPIENIFQKYIDKNAQKKTDQLKNTINNIGAMLNSRFNMTAQDGNVTLLKQQLLNMMSQLIE